MTNDQLTCYAISLGYQLSTNDCQAIRAFVSKGESLEHAVIGYLDAFEQVYISATERLKHGS